MKYLLSAILLVTILPYYGCGTKTGSKEHTIQNEYSISVPENYVSDNFNPDRFSFSYRNKENTISITVEGDPKADYEKRRTQDGSLKQFPYTLKGFSDFLIHDSKKQQDFKAIAHKEATINNMPAILDEFTWKLEGVPCHFYIASVQGSNGKLYRLGILSQQGAVSFSEQVFQSFRLLKP